VIFRDEEEMIELPIVLVEHSGWENVPDEALVRCARLEKACANKTNQSGL
jgi:hypothetical protein